MENSGGSFLETPDSATTSTNNRGLEFPGRSSSRGEPTYIVMSPLTSRRMRSRTPDTAPQHPEHPSPPPPEEEEEEDHSPSPSPSPEPPFPIPPEEMPLHPRPLVEELEDLERQRQARRRQRDLNQLMEVLLLRRQVLHLLHQNKRARILIIALLIFLLVLGSICLTLCILTKH